MNRHQTQLELIYEQMMSNLIYLLKKEKQDHFYNTFY